MIPISFISLPRWPYRDTPSRKAWAYKADYNTILADLVNELEYLSPREVTLSMCLSAKDIRRDGWPLASSRPPHPGVILTVYAKDGPLGFNCDRNMQWQHNLRAISLTLEALRAVERHGATEKRQQYAGYLTGSAQDAQSLKTGAPAPATRLEAAAVLIKATGTNMTARQVADSADAAELLYRAAVKHLHPDQGGDHDQFVRLQQAIQVLRKEAP